ncbi:hypothetical protein J1605_004582 [Eschrichtius robustus]|uniref:Proteasome assembly chaperone 4 n=1 Tax=Eschrichtius robustus TaxID=9764 RepID=A0AB34HJ75_ESCRO|nr:hypothetical protein J1605_004582 [Eschrichtius robustus]
MEGPGAAARGNVSLHNFSARLWEQLVHFHVMRLTDSLFLWVGATPHLRNLSVAMCTRYDPIPVSTALLGDMSDTTSTGLAQRLGRSYFTGRGRGDRCRYRLARPRDLSCLQVMGVQPRVLLAVGAAHVSRERCRRKELKRVSRITLSNRTCAPAPRKTSKQVFVSYNLPNTDSSFTLLVENRIKEEMEAFPEKF